MDKINVKGDALVNAAQIIKRLNDATNGIYQQCSSSIEGKLGEVDDNFRRDLQDFLNKIKDLHASVMECNEENVSAIIDRYKKLIEYEKHIYVRRNLG